MTSVKRIRVRAAAAVGLVAAGLLIAACGGSGNSAAGAANSGTSAGNSGTTAATSTSSGQGGGGGATTISTTKGSAGTFLAGPGGRAIYLWVADKGDKSTCYGGCVGAWPPVLTKGAPKASGAVKASLLGTTKRKDGTTEVTYKGHPLYYYAGDAGPGSTTGQGSTSFGAPWWLVTPAGVAITKH